jgi:hypothetical protein
MSYIHAPAMTATEPLDRVNVTPWRVSTAEVILVPDPRSMSNSQAARLSRSIGLGLFFSLLFVIAAKPVWHDDVFWHLGTAEWIMRTGKVPRVDIFTHTVAGSPWTSHEWGFALLLYAVRCAVGDRGLVLLTSALTTLTFWLIHLQLRRSLAPSRSALEVPLLLVGAGAAAHSCLMLRAALLSSLFLAVLSILLARLHAKEDSRTAVAICALFLLWANCHVGVVFGLVILGLHAAAPVIHYWRSSTARWWTVALQPAARTRAALVLGCAALTLLNPSGFDLWTFPFRVNTLLFHSGLRWTIGHYGAPALARFPCFYVLFALCLLACLPLRRFASQLSDTRRPALAQSLALLFFLGMSLRSNRFILDFVVLALPFCAAAWGAPAETNASTPTDYQAILGAPWLHGVNLVVIAITAAVVRPALPDKALAASVPQGLAAFMAGERIEGRMFNYESSGGYLGWRLHQPVYWDGRNDVVGALAKEWAYTDDFSRIVERHGLDMLVLDPTYYFKLRGYLAGHRQLWAAVYLDEQNVLYLKRTPKFRSVIERSEYTLLQPFGLPDSTEIARLVHDGSLAAALQTELQRLLSQNPDLVQGWYVAGLLARARGDLRGAYGALSRAAAGSDNARVSYELARVAHALGKDDEARTLLLRSMSKR